MVIRALLIWLLGVLPALAGGDDQARLRIIASNLQPVVGEMIAVTIRGEYAQRITLEKLELPSSQDYDWIQLDRDSWRDERIDGRQRKVFERRLAIFPRSAGRLTLGPVTHQLTIAEAGTYRQIGVVTPSIDLSVAPFPVEGRALAASGLQVTETLSASPGALRDGETLTRTVEITATDTLSHMLPERPLMAAPWLISIAAPERRETINTPDGPVSIVVWEWQLRPKTGAPGVLPEITFPWFDTTTRDMKTARLQPIPFGYASFSADTSGAASSPRSWKLLLPLAAGMVAGLGWLLSGAEVASRQRLAQILARMAPDPTVAPLRQAARGDDLFALRRAAEAYTDRRRRLGLPVQQRALDSLDQALFSDQGGAQFDREAFLRNFGLSSAPREQP